VASSAQAEEQALASCVDLDRYPLLQPSSGRYVELVRQHQHQLAAHGVTTLPGFLTGEAVQRAVEEVEEKEGQAYTMQTDHNIYLRESEPELPLDHVRNVRLDTKVAALACDLLEESGPLKTVFRSSGFLEFLRLVLQLPSLHRNVDPIGAVFVNIYRDGYSHNYHFDESHWSTTLLLQESEEGGDFRYTRPFRDEEEEEKTYEVADRLVNRGEEELASTLEFRPGTLNIFQGRRSLHGVTRCTGDRSRLLGVLHYAGKEGVRNSPGVQKLFWGREDHGPPYTVNPTV